MSTKQNFKPMIKAKQPEEMDVEIQDLRSKRASFKKLAELTKSPERRMRFEQKGKEVGLELKKAYKGGK